MKQIILIFCLSCGITLNLFAQDFRHESGTPLRIQKTNIQAPVVKSALELLGRDVHTVLGDTIIEVKRHPEILFSVDSKYFVDKGLPTFEAFHLEVVKGQLKIIGSDEHGLAYGILEVSRLLGVSPWEWWADVTPEKKNCFSITKNYQSTQSPSVQYRGIFINDEDWGMMPWSGLTYEPENGKGIIGPKTNARIFELMLRLRANYFWPAMHECSMPFFLTQGNREVAEKYGIYIGGSHCEPMASSAAGEWRRRGVGDYDYVHNKAEVQRFWENRVREVKDQPIVYTLGMRGVHDGKMQGAKTMTEQREALQQIIADQRDMLSRNLHTDIQKIPQVFIPYKEVLDVYNSGLKVPEDVCLMWCDDNFGYINHFPDSIEQSRPGGNGIYYHVSYWGRPHDYLWLGTFNPHLLYNQMRQAYNQNVRRIWVLNVGDLKPAEYQTELFLDMAWNIEEVSKNGVSSHLHNFLAREFGAEKADTLAKVMEESYQLAFDCKPEFLGHTRTEEKDPKFKIVSDMPWSEHTIRTRLDRYAQISDLVEEAGRNLSASRQDAYFQLIKYPVQAADQMNRKMLLGQLARHGKVDWEQSDLAFDSIKSLTEIYNQGSFNNGKWSHMMDLQPRNLPVFRPLEHRTDTIPMLTDDSPLFEWKSSTGWEDFQEERTFSFETPADTDSLSIEVCLLPTHPINNQTLRFSLVLDDQPEVIISIRTQGRSEEWKQNVLSNQSIKTLTVRADARKKHQILLRPLDKALFLKEIRVKKVK